MHVTKPKTLSTLALTGITSLLLATATFPAIAGAHGNTSGDNKPTHSMAMHGHGHHDGRKWGWWWLSAENFQKRYDAILNKLDAIVNDNQLNIPNGPTLRTNVVNAAANVKTEMAKLKTLKDSYNKESATDEEKAAFKAQLMATKNALDAYRTALKAYWSAIKQAATAAGVDLHKHHKDS